MKLRLPSSRWNWLPVFALLFGFMAPILPASAQGQCNPIITIDTPTANANVQGSTLFGGWAVDMNAPTGSGISGVQIVRDGLLGSGGTVVGPANQVARPDVDTALGRTGSYGFSLAVDMSGISAGQHTFYVYATTSCGPAYASVSVNVQGGITLNVDAPTNGTTVSVGQSLDIGGWSTGTMVTVYLDVPSGQTPQGQGVGSAPVNKPRPDVARVTGRQDLANSGFDVVWTVPALSSGSHSLLVVATGNGGSANVTIQITVQGVVANTNPNPNYNYGSSYSYGGGGFTPSYNGYNNGCNYGGYNGSYGGGYNGYYNGGLYNGVCGNTLYNANCGSYLNNYLAPCNTPYVGYNTGVCAPYGAGIYGGVYGSGYPYNSGCGGIYGVGGIYGGGVYGGCTVYVYTPSCTGSAMVGPTGVTITANTSTSATINWTAVAGATGYTIFQSTTGGGAYAIPLSSGTVPAVTVSGTTATVTGLTPGTTYYFGVAATGPLGTSLPTPTSPVAFNTAGGGGAVVVPVVTVSKNPNGVGAAAGTCPAAGPCIVIFSWAEPVAANNTLITGVGPVGSAFNGPACSILSAINPQCQVSIPATAGTTVHWEAFSQFGGTTLSSPDTALTL